MKLFASLKSKPAAPTAEQSAIASRCAMARINETIQLLEKTVEFQEKKAAGLRANAKALVKSNRQKAIQLLKQARAADDRAARAQTQMDNLQVQYDSLDGMAMQNETLRAMQQGAIAMRGMYSQFTAESGGQSLEDTIEDVQNTMKDAEDISAALSKPLGGPVYDEEDLERELEEMEQMVLDEEYDAVLEEPPRQQQQQQQQTSVVHHHYYPPQAAALPRPATGTIGLAEIQASSAALAAAPPVPLGDPHRRTPVYAAPARAPEDSEIDLIRRMKAEMLGNS